MIKWFPYIVLLLILPPCLSLANNKGAPPVFSDQYYLSLPDNNIISVDTVLSKKTKQQQEAEEKKKIKEIGNARRQPKPEKIDATGDADKNKKTKPKRQRRPEGLERPPEIPRRNGD
jgi:hypothetical protein